MAKLVVHIGTLNKEINIKKGTLIKALGQAVLTNVGQCTLIALSLGQTVLKMQTKERPTVEKI